MARKRGEYQRRKVRQNKIAGILVMLFMIMIPIILVYGIVESSYTIRQINDNTLTEFTGSYSYQIKRTRFSKHRKTYYVFTLDNGDIVSIRRKYLQNTDLLDTYHELTIKYYRIMAIDGFSDSFSAVSITTPDGTVEILDIDKIYRSTVSDIWICSIMLIFSVSADVIIIVLYYHIWDCKKRFQRWQRNRRKMRAQIDASNQE